MFLLKLLCRRGHHVPDGRAQGACDKVGAEVTMRRWFLGALFFTAMGCGSGSGGSGATCPSTSTLTYDNFGRGFFANYCDRCHTNGISPTLMTQAQIQAQRTAIDLNAAAGPNGVNTLMPESGTAPTEAERRQLGEWLACGAR